MPDASLRRLTASTRQGPALWLPTMVLAVLVALVLVHVVVAPLYGVSRYPRVPVLVAAAVLAAALPFVYRAIDRVAVPLEARPGVRRALLGVLLVVMLATQIRTGLAIVVPPGWDAQHLVDAAQAQAAGPGQAQEWAPYFARFPNNLLLATLLGGYVELLTALGVTDVLAGVVVLNALTLSSAVVLVYLSARRVGGPAVAYTTLLLCAVFIGLSPWIAVPYSDTTGMPFPVAILYLFLRAREATGPAQKVAWWGALGLVGVVGYRIRPTILFAVLAAVIVGVLAADAWRRSGRRTTAALVLAATVGGFVGGQLVVNRLVEASPLAPSQTELGHESFSATHYLKMGSQRQPGPYNDFYGAYSEEDVRETISTPPAERDALNVRVYLDRVGDMGALGYAAFLYDKAAWVLGDGSFFMWGEGLSRFEPSPAQDPTSVAIQRFFAWEGDRHAVPLAWWQSVWLVVLALVTGPLLLRSPALFAPAPTLLRLAFLILLLFDLFFEGRARHFYVYLPFVLLLAALSLREVADHLGTRRAVPASYPHAATPSEKTREA